MTVLAIIHELEPRVIFEPEIIQFRICVRSRTAFEMCIDAERLAFPNTELVVRRIAGGDRGVALLAVMYFADGLDIFRGEVHASSLSRAATVQAWQ